MPALSPPSPPSFLGFFSFCGFLAAAGADPGASSAGIASAGWEGTEVEETGWSPVLIAAGR